MVRTKIYGPLGAGEGMSFVGKVSDIPDGQLVAVDIDGERVAIAKVAGELFAIGDVCTHRGCSLSEGEISGQTVICACHGGEFDLSSGEVIGGPPQEGVKSYEVQVLNGEFTVG
jgi:nitrite reductase/ring-hydroxylating ferredoxin subunit